MTFAGEPIDPERFSRDVKVDSREERSQWSRISKMSTVFWQHYLADPKHLDQNDQTLFKNQLTRYQSTGDVLKFG
jgi:hypothetical protein